MGPYYEEKFNVTNFWRSAWTKIRFQSEVSNNQNGEFLIIKEGICDKSKTFPFLLWNFPNEKKWLNASQFFLLVVSLSLYSWQQLSIFWRGMRYRYISAKLSVSEILSHFYFNPYNTEQSRTWILRISRPNVGSVILSSCLHSSL